MAAVALSAFALGCGQDDSPFEQDASGTGGETSQAPIGEQVVDVCREFCEAQFRLGCVRPELTNGGITDQSQCAGLCSFLGLAPAGCQQATRDAYRCQLDQGPCNMTSCNDLLRAAEAACPSI